MTGPTTRATLEVPLWQSGYASMVVDRPRDELIARFKAILNG